MGSLVMGRVECGLRFTTSGSRNGVVGPAEGYKQTNKTNKGGSLKL